MCIVYNDFNTGLKKLIESIKYQKVLLIYSSEASNEDIERVYELLKGEVIYNKILVDNLTREDINSGYRMIILLCTGEDILKLNYNLDEFINVYIPIDNAILPYIHLTNQYKSNESNNYIILKDTGIDINIYCCFAFYRAYSIISALKYNTDRLDFNEPNILDTNEAVKIFNEFDRLVLWDIELIKNENIDYASLGYMYLIILDGYLRLIEDIKSNNIRLVDVYKLHSGNVEIVDKLYKAYVNNNYIKSLLFNSDKIITEINRAKDRIKFLLDNNRMASINVDELIYKIQDYSKTCDNLIELYLYDVFR